MCSDRRRDAGGRADRFYTERFFKKRLREYRANFGEQINNNSYII